MKWINFFFIVVAVSSDIFSFINGRDNVTNDTQLRLMRDLFQDYDPFILPVLDHTQKVVLHVDFNIIQIDELDEHLQILKAFCWLTRYWVDERLRWNETDYDGLKWLFPHQKTIWTPDMAIENSAEEMNSEITKGEFLAKVFHTGQVVTPNAGKTVTTCALDMTYFPYDQHKCIIKLTNWVYTFDQIKLQNKTYKLSRDFYHQNAQWQLVDNYMVLDSYIFDGSLYETIEITLVLKRKPIFYMFNFVVPSAVLAMMSNMMFCLPPESGERISLGITVLLSFSVFQFMIMDKMPDSSDNIPILTFYLLILMGFASLSLLISVIVVNQFHRNDSTPPMWLQQLTTEGITGFVKCVCFKKRVYRISKDKQNDNTDVLNNSEAKPTVDWKMALAKLDKMFLNVAIVISLFLFCVVFFGIAPWGADAVC